MVFMQKKTKPLLTKEEDDETRKKVDLGVVVVDARLSGFGMRGGAATRRRAAVLLALSAYTH